MTTTKPYHPLYNAMSVDWNEQDLAYFGKKPWTNYCIDRHPLESKDKKTSSDACTRYYSRKKFATNPVLVRPPIQKVQNSAQKSGKDADIKTTSDYINDILTTNADGEGLNWYTWLTSEPLAALSRNGLVYIGVDLPATDKEVVTEQDFISGTVPPPKFFHLRAAQVVNWTETEGDIKKGQFSALMYKSTINTENSSGFQDVVEVLVHYTETEIFTYNLSTGAEEIPVQINTFKFVPFVRAEITLSLIGEAVQYSMAAVELNSLSFQNMRDSYFNLLVARGFQIQDSDGKPVPLSADKIVNTPAPEKFLEFIASETAPEGETREQLKALQEQADVSVQQVHSSFAQSIGSGVALKEQGSDAASSVKYMMDILLDKFAVAVHMAMKVVGHPGEVVLIHPENYTFSSEAENIENAEDYRSLAETAPSKEAKKAYTFKANAKIFDGEVLEKVNKADEEAIDNEADDIPII